MTSPPSPSSTENALNALDTRDVTLPQRLWSWLAKRATENNRSVDEVLARLIDEYRHPEQAQENDDASSQENQSQENQSPDTAAERLRRVSTRLQNLIDKTKNEDESTPVQQAEQLLSRVVQSAETGPSSEGNTPSSANGASMFDVANKKEERQEASPTRKGSRHTSADSE